jgi:hypothetical protein
MRWGTAAAAALVAALACGTTARAAEDTKGLLALGVGAFDALHNNTAAEFRGEYRFAQGLYFIKPLVGALGTTDGGVYVYGGLRADLIFFDHYVIMPSAAVGYYDRGSGKDLGSHAEFKTGVELAYRFDNAMRLGVAFDHISNAGLTKRNPGEENLLLMLSVPIGW